MAIEGRINEKSTLLLLNTCRKRQAFELFWVSKWLERNGKRKEKEGKRKEKGRKRKEKEGKGRKKEGKGKRKKAKAK